jgi:hypothetical protein
MRVIVFEGQINYSLFKQQINDRFEILTYLNTTASTYGEKLTVASSIVGAYTFSASHFYKHP